MSQTFDVVDLELDDSQNPVGRVHSDGTIEDFGDGGMVTEDLEKLLGPNREVPYRTSSERAEDEGEVIEEERYWIEPGEPGYLAVFTEVLPFPYEVDWESIDTDALQDPEVTEADGE